MANDETIDKRRISIAGYWRATCPQPSKNSCQNTPNATALSMNMCNTSGHGGLTNRRRSRGSFGATRFSFWTSCFHWMWRRSFLSTLIRLSGTVHSERPSLSFFSGLLLCIFCLLIQSWPDRVEGYGSEGSTLWLHTILWLEQGHGGLPILEDWLLEKSLGWTSLPHQCVVCGGFSKIQTNRCWWSSKRTVPSPVSGPQLPQ